MTLNPVATLNVRIPEWTPGERIRKARRELGLNQEDMAARLDVKRSTYEAWETGRNKPDMTDLAPRLEAVTGISRLWFIGWADGGIGPKGPAGPNTRASGYNVGGSRLVRMSPEATITRLSSKQPQAA